MQVADDDCTALELRDCAGLVQIPGESLGRCKALRTIDLSGCVALVRLPDELPECSALRKLVLTGCTQGERRSNPEPHQESQASDRTKRRAGRLSFPIRLVARRDARSDLVRARARSRRAA